MGPKKNKGPLIIDGVNTSEMTRGQLEKFALTLKETVDREREERNYFQLERDKIRTYWEITKQQLEECRAEIRNRDRELEEKEDEHQGENKVFKQKLKHFLYEHHQEIADLRADGLMSVKMAQEDFAEQETALLTDKKALKEKLVEQQKEHLEEIRTLSMQFSERLHMERKNFELEAREIESKYGEKLQTLRGELELRHTMELTEVDERKNKQIADLMRNHEKAFIEMKNYYNDITLNNLALISNLKEQMEEMKRREDRMEKTLKECQKENRNLSEPMKVAMKENRELKMKLANYSKDKISLANTKKLLAETQKDLDDIKWENEVLELRLHKMEEQKEEMTDRYDYSLIEIQQKSGLKTVLTERKLKALLELIEKREAQFSEMMKVNKIEPQKLEFTVVKLERLLTRKNAAIQDLEYELARISKAYEDLLQLYEGKLLQFGIPKEELGFTPVRSTIATAKGPAGLLTTNK